VADIPQSNRKAIFLDRDGTLNRNTHYLIEFGDFELLPGVEKALRIFQDLEYRLFVVTNQSGVARGYFTYEAVEDLHRKVGVFFEAKGITIEGFAFCPHHPEGTVAAYAKVCDCRKPMPGMLHTLSAKYGVDLTQSFMVGDHDFDAQTGLNAGARGVWLRPKAVPGNAFPQVDNPPKIKEFASLLDFAESLREIA